VLARAARRTDVNLIARGFFIRAPANVNDPLAESR
jgi:hypothetical protein